MFNRSTPKVTDAQRKELQALQKEFSQKIAKILTDAQKTMVADFKKGQPIQPLDAAHHQRRVTPFSERRDMPWTTLRSSARRLSQARHWSRSKRNSIKRSQKQTPQPR